MTEQRQGDWMLTFTGRQYWPMDPRPEDVNIEDIAHSLSMQCRYGGHATQFYSVAEHCVAVSNLVSPENALIALLHDATEAYVADVPRPLKPHLTNYSDIENRNWLAIAEAFCLPVEIPREVHDIDTRICLTEMRRVMPRTEFDLGIKGEAPEIRLALWSPAHAESSFLFRFEELWSERMRKHHPAAFTRRAA